MMHGSQTTPLRTMAVMTELERARTMITGVANRLLSGVDGARNTRRLTLADHPDGLDRFRRHRLGLLAVGDVTHRAGRQPKTVRTLWSSSDRPPSAVPAPPSCHQ